MTELSITKTLLAQLAADLDGPDGAGSGAVCLDAICVIEDLERRLSRPAEPSS